MNATRISSLWGWIFFVVIVVLVGSVNASGKVIYVDDDASLGGNGQNWATPYRYLQDALGTAVSGDEIRVAEGIYKTDEDSAHPGGTGDREATFQLKNGVAVKGGYAGFGEPVPDTRDIDLNETILSGDLNSNDGPNFARNDENSYHVITSSGTDETTLLDGFTIIGGNANGNGAHDKGGGMFNESGSPTLTGCNFTQNSADVDGGGIYGEYANPVMTDCTFTSNSARNGGAINNRYSNLTLTNCAFSGNMAYHGGGINIFRSSAMLTNCAFSGNLATFGGGIYSYEGNQTLSNCTFTGNSASGNNN